MASMSLPRCFLCEEPTMVPGMVIPVSHGNQDGDTRPSPNVAFCTSCTARLWAALDEHDREKAEKRSR